MLNHSINIDFGNKIYGMINMEAIPKFDIKSDIKFDISIKGTIWIGHKCKLYSEITVESGTQLKTVYICSVVLHNRRSNGFIKTVQNNQLISIRSFCVSFHYKDQKRFLSENIKTLKL